jgi:hypothetical protein
MQTHAINHHSKIVGFMQVILHFHCFASFFEELIQFFTVHFSPFVFRMQGFRFIGNSRSVSPTVTDKPLMFKVIFVIFFIISRIVAPGHLDTQKFLQVHWICLAAMCSCNLTIAS